MSLVGTQNFWVVGAKCRFKRESTDTVDYPLQDLGLISNAEPTTEVTKIELNDPGCGVLTKVDEAVTQVNEEYVLTLRNFAPDIIQYLFLSDPPVDYSRTETPNTDGKGQNAYPGQLVQVLNSSLDPEFNLKSVDAVAVGADITAINTVPAVGSQTFTLEGDLDGPWIVTDVVTITGNTYAGTVTINAISYDSANDRTTITVDEDISAGDANGTGGISKTLNDDWKVDSLDLGSICIVTGGSILDNSPLLISYTNNAVSGKRQLKPQSAPIIKGEMYLFLNRDNCDEISIRRANVTLSPTAFDTASTEDYASWQLTASVVSTPEEILSGNGVGEFTYVKGDMPAAHC